MTSGNSPWREAQQRIDCQRQFVSWMANIHGSIWYRSAAVTGDATESTQSYRNGATHNEVEHKPRYPMF